MTENPLNTLKEHDPEFFGKLMEGVADAYKPGKISEKDKLLIAMAIDAADGDRDGVRALAIAAKEKGATNEEILEVVKIVFCIHGTSSMFPTSMGLKDVL